MSRSKKFASHYIHTDCGQSVVTPSLERFDFIRSTPPAAPLAIVKCSSSVPGHCCELVEGPAHPISMLRTLSVYREQCLSETMPRYQFGRHDEGVDGPWKAAVAMCH